MFNRINKKTLLSMGLCLHFGFHIAHADIVVGINSGYEPYEFKDAQGKLVGFDIDLMDEICRTLSEKCTYIDVPFNRLGALIKLGQFNAIISAIAITEARAKQLAFTDPYHRGLVVFIAAADKGIQDPADLNAKAVGVLAESQHKLYLNGEHPGIEARPFETINDAVDALNKGYISAVLLDERAGLRFIKQYPKLAIVGEPIINEKYFGMGEGIAFKKDNLALRHKVNDAIIEIKASGKFQEIYKKWFK